MIAFPSRYGKFCLQVCCLFLSSSFKSYFVKGYQAITSVPIIVASPICPVSIYLFFSFFAYTFELLFVIIYTRACMLISHTCGSHRKTYRVDSLLSPLCGFGGSRSGCQLSVTSTFSCWGSHGCSFMLSTLYPSRFVTKGFVVVAIERRVLVYAALILMVWSDTFTQEEVLAVS